MTAQVQLQLDVLAEVLSEDPDVLTLQALAGRVLPNPRSLTGGLALARALQKLDDEGLIISDGLLVRASRPALYFKRLIASVAIEVVAANILGEPRKANYEAVPRVVYTDPRAAAVGAAAGRFSAIGPALRGAEDRHLHPRLC
ncbi:MAG: hypothetical protein ACTHK3_12920 [Solirubrobacterales bacterium]